MVASPTDIVSASRMRIHGSRFAGPEVIVPVSSIEGDIKHSLDSHQKSAIRDYASLAA